jgi:hypothetical protein
MNRERQLPVPPGATVVSGQPELLIERAADRLQKLKPASGRTPASASDARLAAPGALRRTRVEARPAARG